MIDPADNLPGDWVRANHGWIDKFLNATRGIVQGAWGQRSFFVHGVAAIAVVIAGVIANLDVDHWCLLTLCIGIVLAAEMFNSALESICRAITNKFDSRIQRGLDMASGAVLIVAIAAAIVGVLVFINAFMQVGSLAG